MPEGLLAFVKRALLVAIEQALPRQPSLSSLIKNVRCVLLAIIVTGVLIAFLILFACFGIYQLLIYEGLSLMTALFISTFLLFSFLLISLVIAQQCVAQAEKSEQADQTPFIDNSKIAAWESAINSFIEGVREK
ncbi:MAG: hypothetical protein K0R63_37 [Rickettsiales bacterium]|jgi:hypothetical protein|nr:hypothetical protein [Rickettsiales bacterium]